MKAALERFALALAVYAGGIYGRWRAKWIWWRMSPSQKLKTIETFRKLRQQKSQNN